MITTTYILNRMRTKRMKDVTLKEAWSKIKPNVSHLKVFGLVCYKHTPDQLRRKLDDKGTTHILVGYHSIRGYRLFSPKQAKLP